MKKLVSVLFAALLVGSFAFAEVNVGAWGRFTFVPAASVDGEDNVAFTSPTWADGSRVGVNFSGTSDNVGFNVNLDANGGAWGVGDQAKIWVKFNDMVKLQGGKVQQDVLRGKIGGSSIIGNTGVLTFAPKGAAGEDDIFKRFEPNLGIVLDVTPAEGVYIGAALNAGERADQPTLTESMMKNIQIGGGYVIADMGHARVQYIGADDLNDVGLEVDEAKYIQAAFAYTAMEGLLVDAGIKYNIGEAGTGQSQFAAAAKYTKDALSLIGRALVAFGEAAPDDDDLAYRASADVAYTVADPLAIGLEGLYYKRGDVSEMTFMPYTKLGYGNGHFKAGFLYNTNDDGVEAISSWMLPIQLQYSF